MTEVSSGSRHGLSRAKDLRACIGSRSSSRIIGSMGNLWMTETEVASLTDSAAARIKSSGVWILSGTGDSSEASDAESETACLGFSPFIFLRLSDTGWQPGLQETAADWDEEWDKFQEEGFTLVKEFTLDVQNVIAPPKEKSSRRVEATAAGEVQTDPSSPLAEESRESPSNVDAHVMENGVHHNESENGTPRSAPRSPAAPSSAGSPKDSTDPTFGKNSLQSSAVFDRDNLSDHEAAGSVHSGDRTFDDPARGTSENDDLDSVWGFNAIASSSPWEIDHDRLRDDNFLSGSKTDFGLNPIRTGSQHGTNSPRRSTFFDESAPSTPLYTPGPQTGSHQRSIFFDESVPSTPLSTSGTQPQRSSMFFDESIPSTPLYSSAFSSTRREQSGPSFDISLQFDSFNSHDTLTRFESIRSRRDDFDQGHGFPSFYDSDPFGTGPFRTSRESPRSSDHWNAFS